MVGGETLLVTLFGARYRASAGPLAILAWSVVLGFLNYLLWYSLLAAYRERAKLKIMLVGLGLNVALNAALIPTLGPSGAAISLIATDLLIVTWQGVLVRRHLFALSLAQLKVLQEAITLSVFVPFAVLYMRQPIKSDFIWAGLCLVGAVYFVFRT